MPESKLKKHQDEILDLINQGYGYYTIGTEFEKKYGYKSGSTNKYIKRLAKKDPRFKTQVANGKHSVIKEYAEAKGFNPNDVGHYWHKGKLENGDKISAFVKPEKLDLSEIDRRFEEIAAKYSSTEPSPYEVVDIDVLRQCKVTVTDHHVGLNPNPNGNALFQYEYDQDSYNDSMTKVYQAIVREFKTYGTFDQIVIDNLGDHADGFNGQTARGGHFLPQNMTNEEIFDTCVDSSINMVSSLVKSKMANKIILRSVSNDNHGGQFSLIINKAVQKIANALFDSNVVEVDVLKRFMEHRVYGDHAFILTHGKDEKDMKRGLPLRLDDKTVNFINSYIDHYDIDSKYIHVEKGDLHQVGFDKTKKFDYRNYMSFAPPSNWIGTNFGDTYSGFSIQVVPKFSNEISHTDIMLNYKKKSN